MNGVDLVKRSNPQAATELRQREQRALQMHLAGMTFEQIGVELGYSDRSGPYKAVHRLLKREEAEGAAEVRAVGQARMDRLLAAVWAKALRGDLKAVAEARRLEESRWRLMGAVAPVQAVVRVRSELDAQIEELVDELNQRIAGDEQPVGEPVPEGS